MARLAVRVVAVWVFAGALALTALGLDAVTLPGREGARAGMVVVAGIVLCAVSVAAWIAAGRIGGRTL